MGENKNQIEKMTSLAYAKTLNLIYWCSRITLHYCSLLQENLNIIKYQKMYIDGVTVVSPQQIEIVNPATENDKILLKIV